MKLRNPLVAALAFSASVLVSSLGLLAPTYAQSDATDQPSAPPLPMLAQPVASPVPSLARATYRAKSPEYGMNVFVWGNPSTTDRDLGRLRYAGFTWQKIAVPAGATSSHSAASSTGQRVGPRDPSVGGGRRQDDRPPRLSAGLGPR